MSLILALWGREEATIVMFVPLKSRLAQLFSRFSSVIHTVLLSIVWSWGGMSSIDEFRGMSISGRWGCGCSMSSSGLKAGDSYVFNGELYVNRGDVRVISCICGMLSGLTLNVAKRIAKIKVNMTDSSLLGCCVTVNCFNGYMRV